MKEQRREVMFPVVGESLSSEPAPPIKRSDKRKVKRTINWLRKKAGYGKYIVDCRYHPCVVTRTEFYTDDLYGNGCESKSLIDGTTISCSYMYCLVEPISKEKAEAMAEFAKNADWDAYMARFYDEEVADDHSK